MTTRCVRLVPSMRVRRWRLHPRARLTRPAHLCLHRKTSLELILCACRSSGPASDTRTVAEDIGDLAKSDGARLIAPTEQSLHRGAYATRAASPHAARSRREPMTAHVVGALDAGFSARPGTARAQSGGHRRHRRRSAMDEYAAWQSARRDGTANGGSAACGAAPALILRGPSTWQPQRPGWRLAPRCGDASPSRPASPSAAATWRGARECYRRATLEMVSSSWYRGAVPDDMQVVCLYKK